MARTLAIGDIHGCLTAFETLIDALEIGAEDTVVTLGDYVDRGPDSRGVIDLVLRLRESCKAVTLRGNHEIMMLRARGSKLVERQWRGFGGEEALQSYGGSFDAVPAGHWEFLEGLLPYYESGNHVFVHANLHPQRALDVQRESELYWQRFEPSLQEPLASGKVMVCGHTSQRSGDPVDLGHSICIDTCAYGGGWLTCLDVDSGELWQANQQGDRRGGNRQR